MRCPSTILLIGLLSFAAKPVWAVDYQVADNSWKKHKTPVSPSFGIDAYSGMAIDTPGRNLYLFGGGHNDYVLNDLWSFSIPLGKWTQIYPPDKNPLHLLDCKACFSKKLPGAYYPKGRPETGALRPLARHTYSNIEVIFNRQAQSYLFFTGKYGPGAGDSRLPFRAGGDTWTYATAEATWQYRQRNRGDGEGAAVWVPPGKTNGGRVYTFTKNNDTAIPNVHSYNIDTDHWKKLRTRNKQRGIPHVDQVANYVPREHAIYLFSGKSYHEPRGSNSLWKLDLNKLRWTRVKAKGEAPPPGSGQGLAYDSKNHVFISIYSRANPVLIFVFDLNNQSWKKLQTLGELPQIRGARRIYNRFRYDTVENVFFLVAAEKHSSKIGTWIYRYKK